MRVLVIGSGAREHAILWKLRQSPLVGELFAAPGNAGIAQIATCVPLGTDGASGAEEQARYAAIARENDIDLTIVGPEALLVDGLVDHFQEEGLRVFGPTAAAANLEGSKIWAKDVMLHVGIPTAAWRAYTTPDEARARAELLNWHCVIKADGLAAGKGAHVCTSPLEVDDALAVLFDKHADKPVLVEELLDGQEVSVFAITDGRTVVPFGAAQDHKRLGDRDEGPNTGGMGAYSPVQHMRLAQELAGTFFEPVVDQLAAQGTPYVGVLYAGAIVTDQGPKILEFNCRFGDPEAQVLLSRFSGDLADICWRATEQQLHTAPPMTWDEEEALCVVIAADTYPGEGSFGQPIEGVAEAGEVEGVLIFHSGTDRDLESGRLVTNGGRIVSVTGLGATLKEARSRAYKAVERIHFPGMFYRNDIGTKAIGTVWQSEWRKSPRWELHVLESSQALGSVASELDELQSSPRWTKVEAQQLGELRNRVYDIVLMLNDASAGKTPGTAARLPLSRLTHEFDELLERMQRPGNAEGVDAVFRRANKNRVRLEARGPADQTKR